MKKYIIALTLFGILPAFAGADAYGYTSQRYGNSSKTNVYKRTNTSRKAGGYSNTISNNFYYSQPVSNRSAGKSRNVSVYDNSEHYSKTKQDKEITKSYSTQERKFFLAHPFFQPLQGHFGSVTDVFYTQNNFKFDVLNGTVIGLDPQHNPLYGDLDPVLGGTQETSQFIVKEDFSFGLSDTLSLIAMAQYDKTKVSFKDWSDGTPSDSYSHSGLDVFGIGFQNRFVDTDEWIAMVAGFFQHQRNTANSFIGEVKAGYKVPRTTIYGLARVGYSDLTDGDIYGAFVTDEMGDYLMLSYKTDVKNVFYIEGGAGVFAVLSKDFTLNGEMLYSHYDWHNQLSIKGGLGWQPGDMFALNLYASTVLHDSAKGQTNKYMSYDVNPVGYPTDENGNPYYTDSKVLYTVGDYKIKDYKEWKIGAQVILYF